MPTRKIRDLEPSETCRDREHNPPSMMVYSPGVYEHVCPSCGKVTTFTVRSPTWTSHDYPDMPTARWNDEGKNVAAVDLGRRGGLVGGRRRAESLSPERRSEIARKAANTRWGNSQS